MKKTIINQINIQEYIERYIPLQKRGINQCLGLCPFHHEKTPSFSINIEKGYFYCFGCKASGDIIKFAMLYHKCDYYAAIKLLSDDIGINIEINTNKFIDINKKFSEICNQHLHDKTCYYGLNYLYKRKLKVETIQKYNLGYLPLHKVQITFNILCKFFNEQDVLKSGLFKENCELKSNDKYHIISQFAGRIIFPIFNHNNIVGFGSRIIHDNMKPKYLNSADSEIFQKSTLLYGFNQLNHNKKDTIFVVEGYMDVISLANHNIQNCVGVLGANLSVEQLKSLWSINDKPTICFDNDHAGNQAMQRVAELALKYIIPSKTLYFLELNNCKDPDEFIHQHGYEKFLQYVNIHRISLADFIYKMYSQSLTLNNPDDSAILKQNIENACNSIQNTVLRHEYRKYFSKILHNDTQSNMRKISNKNEFLKNTVNSQNVNNIANIKDIFNIQLKLSSEQEMYEEKICNILLQNKSLLKDQEILADFIECKFYENTTEVLRSQLLIENSNIMTNLHYNKEVKRILQRLMVLLQIKNVQEEINQLKNKKDYSLNIENQILKLKQHEIQLKHKLSSTLI